MKTLRIIPERVEAGAFPRSKWSRYRVLIWASKYAVIVWHQKGIRCGSLQIDFGCSERQLLLKAFTFLREIREIRVLVKQQTLWIHLASEKSFKEKKSLNFHFLQEQILELVFYNPSFGGNVSLWFCVFWISRGLIYIRQHFRTPKSWESNSWL